jgi:DNA-binding transcriptional ArsR family regulator
MLMTLSALADPNRFQIVELLRSGPRHVGEIEKRLKLQQPQVSKHLRVLREAGIVVSHVDAQRRIYELRPQPFRVLDEWLGRYRSYWDARLDDLETHLENSRTEWQR